MRFDKALMSSAVVLAAFAGAQAQAAGPTLSDVLGNSGITVGGAFDVSYDFAANDDVRLRAFDIENDGFSFHQANLTASKAFEGGIGATLNVVAGDDAQLTSGDGDEFDVLQGFVSYGAGNLSLMGGRFVTLAGMEVINPAGNLNASRSLLFFTQPLIHEGVRASYKVNDLLSVTLGLVNQQYAGSESDENNTDLSVEAQVALLPTKNLSLYLTGYSGNEDDGDGPGGNSADLRADLVDLVVNFNLTDSIYLGLNADYYNTEDGMGGHFEAQGVAGYAQVKLTPALRVALRSEYLTFDTDGELGFGASGLGESIVTANTLTLGYAVTSNLELLVEGRHDRAHGGHVIDTDGDEIFDTLSNQIFAPIDAGAENDQYTGTIKAILKF